MRITFDAPATTGDLIGVSSIASKRDGVGP